ncbi:hypothetical protein ACIP93_33430 [Streptomyces sp. NPDC088745]|uniref:hypothetical protein n=1 Tax=Streptomyces sp. NPDC088745 TaxID=3365884 RepID=UPI0037F744BA
MSTTTTERPSLSDRAHRALFQLALHVDGEWVEVADICTGLGLNSHQIRHALKELRDAGMAERRRRYVRAVTGRTHRTYFRLTGNPTSEASA